MLNELRWTGMDASLDTNLTTDTGQWTWTGYGWSEAITNKTTNSTAPTWPFGVVNSAENGPTLDLSGNPPSVSVISSNDRSWQYKFDLSSDGSIEVINPFGFPITWAGTVLGPFTGATYITVDVPANETNYAPWSLSESGIIADPGQNLTWTLAQTGVPSGSFYSDGSYNLSYVDPYIVAERGSGNIWLQHDQAFGSEIRELVAEEAPSNNAVDLYLFGYLPGAAMCCGGRGFSHAAV
jgi:hypothetical protein